MEIWRHVAWWISKATCAQVHAHARASVRARTHTQKYVILIAFPRQQWFRERASVLYVHCLYLFKACFHNYPLT
jgi:hypothetical protein